MKRDLKSLQSQSQSQIILNTATFTKGFILHNKQIIDNERL